MNLLYVQYPHAPRATTDSDYWSRPFGQIESRSETGVRCFVATDTRAWIYNEATFESNR